MYIEEELKGCYKGGHCKDAYSVKLKWDSTVLYLMRKETTMGNGQFSLQKRNLSSEKKNRHTTFWLIVKGMCYHMYSVHVQCTCHQSNETKQQWAFYLSLQWVEVWDTFPVLEIHWSEKILNKCAVPKKYPYPSSGRYSGLNPPPPSFDIKLSFL